MTPKWITRKLMACFKQHPTLDGEWFIVWDEKVNEWLLEKYGLYTGPQETYNLDNAFKLRFDWVTQTFKVTA